MARTILGGYKAYHFKEHDEVLDKLSRLYELAGVTKANGRPDLKRISYLSGLTEGTLSRWENRHVKRPQHPAVQAVVRGLGGKYEITYKGRAIGKVETKTRANVVALRAARKKKVPKKKGGHLRLVA